LADFTPFFRQSAEPKATLRAYTVPGFIFHIHVIHFFLVMFFGETLLLQRYLQTKDTMEGKRIFYSGDFREHGRKPMALNRFLKAVPKEAATPKIPERLSIEAQLRKMEEIPQEIEPQQLAESAKDDIKP